MRWIVFSVRGLVRSADGEIMLVKRSQKSRYCPGLWEVAGGKLETFNFKNNFRREIEEEAGLLLAKIAFLGIWLKRPAFNKIVFGWRGWQLILFVEAFCPAQKIKLSDEHTEGGWFTLAQAEALDLTPETRRVLRKYARRRGQT